MGMRPSRRGGAPSLPPRGIALRRRGQLALFDAVLFLPLIALTVVVVDAILLSPVSAPTQNLVGEHDAQQTLATLMRTTLRSTQLPGTTAGSATLLEDLPVSELLAETLQGLACSTVGPSNLMQPGFVGGDVAAALQATAQGWSFAALTSNSTGCGTPVHLDLGPAPPYTEVPVYTAWTVLPAMGSSYAPVTVGVELWGP